MKRVSGVAKDVIPDLEARYAKKKKINILTVNIAVLLLFFL
jgi:hypothetical protein